MKRTKYLSRLIWSIVTLWLMVHGSVALCATWTSVAISTFSCYAHVVRANQYAPVIEHTAVSEVNILNHNITLVSTLESDAEILGATLCYRLNGTGDWNDGVMTLPVKLVDTKEKNSLFYYDETASTITYKGAYYSVAAATAGATIHYFIKCRNKGFETLWKSTATPQIITIKDYQEKSIGPSGGFVALESGNINEGKTKIVVPVDALSTNEPIRITYKDPATVPARDKTEMLTTEPAAAYDFTPNRLRFGTQVAMTLWYSSSAVVNPADIARLKAFYYDETGSEWRMVGGTVNTSSHTVTFNTDHFTLYALFPVRTTANTYRPKERIITPASAEGINDWAQFDGLMGTTTTIKIYDVLGRLIRTIDAEPYQWNGKDDNGYIVESGVYIYQFKADVDGSMKLISGTIAVAK